MSKVLIIEAGGVDGDFIDNYIIECQTKNFSSEETMRIFNDLYKQITGGIVK